MSFILDALKKSEAERARQAGPALLEMRIVRPRHRIAPWIIVLALLLGINAGVLLWYALRRDTAVPPAAPAIAAAPAAATSTPAAAAPQPHVAAPAAPAGGAAQPAEANRAALPPPAAFAADPGARIAGADDADSATGENPADLEPAGPPAGSVSVARGGGTRPNYSEVSGSVPELRLDLHVYANRPQDRYALINMHKVHEGDALPEGPRVLEITRDGVVLEWHGSEFLLGRE